MTNEASDERETVKLRGSELERATKLRELADTEDLRCGATAVAALADPAWSVRVAALEVLGKAGDSNAGAAIAALLTDVESLVQVAAIEALVAVHERGMLSHELSESIGPLTDDPSELVRAFAVWGLGSIGLTDRRRADLDARGATEASAVVRAAIAEALYRSTRDEKPLAALEGFLAHDDPEARAFAASSLVAIATARTARRLLASMDQAIARETFPAILEALVHHRARLAACISDDSYFFV